MLGLQPSRKSYCNFNMTEYLKCSQSFWLQEHSKSCPIWGGGGPCSPSLRPNRGQGAGGLSVLPALWNEDLLQVRSQFQPLLSFKNKAGASEGKQTVCRWCSGLHSNLFVRSQGSVTRPSFVRVEGFLWPECAIAWLFSKILCKSTGLVSMPCLSLIARS